MNFPLAVLDEDKQSMVKYANVVQIISPIAYCNATTTIPVKFGFPGTRKEELSIIGEACYSESEGRTLFIRTKHSGKGKKQQVALKTEQINYLNYPKPDDKYENYIATALHYFQHINPKLFLRKQYFIQPEFFTSINKYDMIAMDWNFFLTNGVSPDHMQDYFPNYDLLLKDIMSMREQTFELYIGAHSVLTQTNFVSRPVNIYLVPEESKYPVPKYVWVVVKTTTKKAIAFLILNDIHASDEYVARAKLCESKCSEIRWLAHLRTGSTYNKTRNGYVWCCELNSFAKHVREMPRLEGKYTFLT